VTIRIKTYPHKDCFSAAILLARRVRHKSNLRKQAPRVKLGGLVVKAHRVLAWIYLLLLLFLASGIKSMSKIKRLKAMAASTRPGPGRGRR
jgi:hypothetical protein